MASNFTFRGAGVAELLRSSEAREVCRPAAESILAQARANAPVDEGELAASGHLEDDTTDRAVIRVVFDAPHALPVEARVGYLSRALG